MVYEFVSLYVTMNLASCVARHKLSDLNTRLKLTRVTTTLNCDHGKL